MNLNSVIIVDILGLRTMELEKRYNEKLLFISICISLLLFGSVNADEVKQKTNEELIAEFMRLDQQIAEEKKKQAEAIAKTQAMKRETESIKKVGRKLDELLGVLSNNK